MVAGAGLAMEWGQAWRWLLGAEYVRVEGIPTLVLQHILYAAVPLAAAVVIALPLGMWVGHTGRGGTFAINLTNVGRAIPSLGVVIIAFIAFGLGFWPVYITLVAMAIPPIVTNTYVGIRQVDPEVREAAEGMGLSGMQILRRVEIPIAMPVIMAGVRTSAVQVVATATLAAYVGLGGLGRPIFSGLATNVQASPTARTLVFGGVVAVALLAIATEKALGLVERKLVPDGLTLRAAAERARATTGTPTTQPQPDRESSNA